MAYPPVPSADRGPVDAGEAAIRALLADLAERKEFSVFQERASPAADSPAGVAGFLPDGEAEGSPLRLLPLLLPGLRLSGAQLFLRNFFSPDTVNTRLAIIWQTGAGKTIAAAAIAHEYARRARAAGAADMRVFYISFTPRETIQEDLLRHPEFGFVSAEEVAEVRRLRAAAASAGQDGGLAADAAKRLAGYTGTLRRRITDRTKGGYYQFYGYKEFASALFQVTAQGAAAGWKVQSLTALRGDSASAAPDFGAALAAAVRAGSVRVNEALLGALKGSLIICDEFQDVYNIQKPNNYGVALQYALDVLDAPAEAPRAVFMSATPMTGSAAEIVDFLNLLVPREALRGGVPLQRGDFFRRAAVRGADGDGEREFVVSQLLEGGLERIRLLAAGRVSFLLDADVGAYPRRVFVGEPARGVPYLLFTPCPMSPLHARTLDAAAASRSGAEGSAAQQAGLPEGAYALYDMVFPSPDGDPEGVGLYLSADTVPRIARAPEEWRARAGVVVEPTGDGAPPILSGRFLGLDRVGTYSTKYETLARLTIEAIRAGPGKIMVYHHRVRSSGVLLLQELYRMNGIADEGSPATDATLCGVCGLPRRDHRPAVGGHEYVPARFVVAHSEIDRSAMLLSIMNYNAPDNRDGHQYRILIGSKIVRQSLNFRAVRHLFVCSLPTDFPTLIQVFGRVVRKYSHADLPPDQRDVRIRVLASTRADGHPSPEMRRYADKGREFLVIQEVERALRQCAVDGFLNFPRVEAALRARGRAGEASLDGLPYAPAVARAAAAPRTATFLAYGHGEREVALIAAVVAALFRARPVWTRPDLWDAVRAGAVAGAHYDPALFDEGNFLLALGGLARTGRVLRAGRFFVAPLSPPPPGPQAGETTLRGDVECYLRAAAPAAKRAVRVADFLREARAGRNFEVRLREFDRRYLGASGKLRPLDFALVEYTAEFHYALLRRLIESDGAAVTSDDPRVADMYARFRILVRRGSSGGPPKGKAGDSAATGYAAPDAVHVYDRAAKSWRAAPLAEFGLEREHGRGRKENDIVVGFVTPAGRRGASHAAASLKLRPPLAALQQAGVATVREAIKGAVCETRPRAELAKTVAALRAAALRASLEIPAAGVAEAAVKSQTGAALCDAVRALLLALEERARDPSAPAGGALREFGRRYLYLAVDRAPAVTALVVKRPAA